MFSSMLFNQKLSTRSSTNLELVGVAHCMPKFSYFRLFIDSQKVTIKKKVVLQDNKSATLIEKNGRSSCSKRSRHLNIMYFHVTDATNKGEIKIDYYPTEKMLLDFFFKRLQASLFLTKIEWL